MLNIYHSPTYLLSFHFFFSSSMSTLQIVSFAAESASLVISFGSFGFIMDTMPSRWAFYFQDSGLPFSLRGTWPGSMHKVQIALEEHWSVALMLHRLTFYLSGKVYLWNQGGMVSLFLCRIAYCILNLGGKHGITLIPTHIPTHLSMEGDYILWGRMGPEWNFL